MWQPVQVWKRWGSRNDFLRQISIAPAPKRKPKRRVHGCEALEPRAMLTAYAVSVQNLTDTDPGTVGGFAIAVSPTLTAGVSIAVAYELSGTAISDGGIADPDWTAPTSGTVTLSANASNGVVPIAASVDTDGDLAQPEEVDLTVTSLTPYGAGVYDTFEIGSPAENTISVAEAPSDGPTVHVTLDPTSVVEGTAVEATATISGLTAASTLTWTASCSDPADLGGHTLSGTIANVTNSISYTFAVPTVDDGDTTETSNDTQPLTIDVSVRGAGGSATGSATADITETEPTVPTFSISGTSGTEPTSGTSDFIFTITASPAPTTWVYVNYLTHDGTATDGTAAKAGTDYIERGYNVPFSKGQSTLQIAVPVIDDGGFGEPAQTFSVALSNPTGGVLSNTASSATGTIYEDKEPTLTLGDAVGTEPPTGTTWMTFNATVSPPPDTDAYVDYTTVDGSGPGGAFAGVDYAGQSGTLHFTPGQTTPQPIAVNVLNDDWTNESTLQQFSIRLSEPIGVELAGTSATGSIYDYDDDATTPAVSVSNATADEESPSGYGNSELTFNLTLSAPSAVPVTVDYETKNGTATANDDYDGQTSSVVFSTGDTTAQVFITVNNDVQDDPTGDPENSDANKDTATGQEPDTSMSLVLTGADYATLGTASVGIGTIHAGDVPDNQPSYCTCACSCGNVMTSENPANGSLQQGSQPATDEDAGMKGESANDPNPIITVDDQLSPSVAQANDIKVELTFGTNLPAGSQIVQDLYYSPTGYSTGETVVFAQQINAAALPDGRYDWTMTVTEEHTDDPAANVTRTYTGGYNLQNTDTGPFGPGWLPQAVDRLYPTTGGVELVDGNGNAWFYASVDEVYKRPANAPDFAYLNNEGSYYSLGFADGSYETFDSLGLLTARYDHLGNETTFSYTTDNKIQSITDPEGRTTTFSYTTYGSQNLVTSVTDGFGRVTTYDYANRDSDNVVFTDGLYRLSSITEPNPGDDEAQSVTAFGYNSQGQETSVTTADGTTNITYDQFGGVSSIQTPDQALDNPPTKATYTSPLEYPLVDAADGFGTSTKPAALVNAASVVGTQTDVNLDTTKFTIGLNGLVTSSTDALRNTTYTKYNAAGQPIEIDAPGPSTGPDKGQLSTTKFQYDSSGNLIKEQLPDGSTETWTYNTAWNEVTSFIDPLGRETDYQINTSNGEVMSMTQVGANGDANRVTTYTYTPQTTAPGQVPGGLLASQTDPRHIETDYSYTTDGMLAAVTYAVGTAEAATVSYGYTDDVLTSETDELGRTTTFKVDSLGRTIETDSPPPDPNQPNVYPVTTQAYDALGRLKSQTIVQSVSGGATASTTTNYVYKKTGDEDAPVVEEIDAAGTSLARTLTYSYDSADNLLTESDGLGRITAFQYDADNRQTAQQDPSSTDPVPTDPNGGANNDTFNRQTADGPVTSAAYGPAGNVIAQIDAAGNETDNVYDLRGNLLASTGPAPVSGGPRPTITYGYNNDQEVVSQTDAVANVSTLQYNSFGELIERQDPSPNGDPSSDPGPITKYQYDQDGNLVAVIDARGNETQYVYNDRNQRVEEIDPAPGGTTSYSYNAALELVQGVDATGHITQYQYNADGERTATIAPNLATGLAGDGSTTTDGYDLAGNLVSETVPNGGTTTNQYDLLNQLVKTTQPVPGTGGAAPVTVYGYDPAGELTTTTNALGLTQTDTFDGLGRVTDDVGFNGVTTANTYNLLSKLVSTEQEGGGITANQTTNAYDNLGRLVSTTDGNHGVTSFGYDLVGDRTSLTDGDGNVTRWQFDTLNRPIAERLPTGALEAYQYDANGNLLQSVDGDGHIIQYAYNSLNEPTSETWLAMPAVVSAPPETIQSIVVDHGATGGDWTLSFNGGGPQSIAYNGTAADVQAALDNITALKGNVDVTGSGTPADPFLIAFVGALANTPVSLLTADFSGLMVPSVYAQTDARVSPLTSPGSGLNQQQVAGYASTADPVTQGDFELTFEGQTAAIPYNATPDAVQTALGGLSTIGAGNVIVTGPATPNDGSTGSAYYTITFSGLFSGDEVLPAVTIQADTLADSHGGAVSVQSWIVASAPQPQGEVQQVIVTAAAGAFSLGFEGETTAPIDLPATASDVQTALENLPLIGSGNVQVTGLGTWASPFLVVFVGALAGQAESALTVADAPTTVNTVSTTYNAASQISTIGDSYSDYTYTYDGEGNTATVDNAGTPGAPDVVLSSQYDAMGNRTSLSATIGGVKDFINSYSYDALSRLDGIDQQNQTGGNAVAPKSIYYGLDAIGDVTSIDRANTVDAGPQQNGPAYSVLSYSATTGQLTGINHEYMGASLDNLTYAYDGVGRVSTFGSIDGTATYGYDPISQLVSATYTAADGHTEPPNLSLSFDTNGNRTSIGSTTTTVAPDNHLANDGTFAFGYDGAGNLITRTRISDAAANDYKVIYTWDTANRLVQVQDLNNSLAPNEQISYTYDVYGDLIERVDDVIGGATTTVHYVWNGDGMVLAFDGNGNLTNRYLNGPNTSAYDQFYTTLAQEDVTSPTQQGTVTWPLLDAQGSVIDVADESGTVIDHIEYNATGAVFSESDPSVSHIASFQGGYRDPATGMAKYGARWEVMADAFWASQDPIGFLGGSMNLTESRGNDATNATDNSGMGDYVSGKPTPPAIPGDNDFPYDENAEATAWDLINWEYYGGLAAGANAIGYVPDGTRSYAHYRGATGTDLQIDYNKAYAEDAWIRQDVDDEIASAQAAAERIRGELGRDSFQMTGSAVPVLSRTDNWRKTLGGHSIWGAADVTYNPCDQTYTMHITISAEDVYNFNKGQADIATAHRDEDNGRFQLLGWAKQFRTYGQLERFVTWKDGNAPGSSDVCDATPRDRSRDRGRGAERDRDRRDRSIGSGRYGL